MDMHESNEALSNVTDIQVARLEKYIPEVPLPNTECYETSRSLTAVRYAGMIIRAVITEPLGTQEHLDKPAIIIKHGFMASRPAYNEFAKHLAAAGNRVVHYGMPRTSSMYRQFHHKNLINPLRTHSQAIGGVSEMLHARYPDSPERHRLIGHSMGGLAVSKFIAHKPEYVDSAILLASAGLAEHTFPQMAGRALKAVNDEIIPFVRDGDPLGRHELGVHSLWHIARNPLFLLREGYQAATDNALPNVDRARSSGIRVGAIWMAQDSFFPLHEIDEDVQSHFDETTITVGNHLSPQEFPKQSAFEALAMFDKLKNSNVAVTSASSSTIA